MRKTKIICTIGPACSEPLMLEQLIKAGMDVARLNFSHGSHKSHTKNIRTIRSLSKKLNKPVAIIQDLCGPKIRVGSFLHGAVNLQAGQRFILWDDGKKQGDGTGVGISYPTLSSEVGKGSRILLADGSIELVVQARGEHKLICEVLTGGVLSSRKGINLPGTSLNVAAVTAKDLADVRLGIAMGVDFVALSFIRRPEDIDAIKKVFKKKNSHIPIIAKIEKHEALGCLDKILDAVSGVMVARGDLGVEIPLERVPLVQKEIIKMANRAGKPVITATQMLRSMVASPRPTRAEAADVANAVMDGTDAVMLSEETATGIYPAQAVKCMSSIAMATEKALDYKSILRAKMDYDKNTIADSVSYAACQIAQNIGAKLIVTTTQSGYTARMIARFRPKSFVLAMTPSLSTQKELALSWGVWPCLINETANLNTMLTAVTKYLKQTGLAKQGERVVVTAGVPLKEAGNTNLIKVITAD